MLKNGKKLLLIVLISGSFVHSISILAMHTNEDTAEEQQMIDLALALSASEQPPQASQNNNQKQLISAYDAIIAKIEELKSLYGEEEAERLVSEQDMNFKDLETAQERLVHFTRLISLRYQELEAEEKRAATISPRKKATTATTSASKTTQPSIRRHHPYAPRPSKTNKTPKTAQPSTPATQNIPRVYFSQGGISTGNVFNIARDEACPISAERFEEGMQIVHLECGHTLSFESFNDLLARQIVERPAVNYTPQEAPTPHNDADQIDILNQLLDANDTTAVAEFLEYQQTPQEDINLYDQGAEERAYEAEQASSRRCPLCQRSFDQMKNVYVGQLPVTAAIPQIVMLEARELKSKVEKVGNEDKTVFFL